MYLDLEDGLGGAHPSERAASETRLQPSVTWDISIFQEIVDSQVFIENIPRFKIWKIIN